MGKENEIIKIHALDFQGLLEYLRVKVPHSDKFPIYEDLAKDAYDSYIKSLHRNPSSPEIALNDALLVYLGPHISRTLEKVKVD